jgi:6-phosphofructokinase 1
MTEPNDQQRFAILTSGGDAPGMNSAIRAATMLLKSRGHSVLGVRAGFKGLIRNELNPLQVKDVDGILREGGTILGSARSPDFRTPEGRERARRNLRERGVDGLVVIGGNGSLAGLQALVDQEEADGPVPNAIGIPASIDNDIGYTGLSIGVDTAMNTIVDACDKIADTARAFDRTFLVEVMGRDCGYLSMTSAIASGAELVLFPESGDTEEEIVQKVVDTALRAASRQARPRGALIIKSEGCDVSTERLKELVDEELDAELGEDLPQVETRVTVLGHVVRGGRPSAFDRLLASRLAHAAVDALLEGESGRMSAWMMPEPPPDEVSNRSDADPYCWLVDIDAVLAETDRIREGTSSLVEWRTRVFDNIEDVLVM